MLSRLIKIHFKTIIFKIKINILKCLKRLNTLNRIYPMKLNFFFFLFYKKILSLHRSVFYQKKKKGKKRNEKYDHLKLS